MSFTILEGQQSILNKYKNSGRDIVHDFTNENEIKSDYQKREIFELLQNADDEAEDNKEVDVRFSLVGNTLKIQNTGKPFLEENIGCLMYSGTSTKSIRKNKIGNKGRGFRAVLNWADTVRIITKQFAVEFSKEHAIKQITTILNENADIKDEVKKIIGDILPATIFSYPKMITPEKSKYATTIELICLDEHIETIKDDLNSLDFREMLFLSNIRKITIDIQGQKTRIVERIKENNSIIIGDSNNSNAEQGIWRIYKSKGKIKCKEYEFIIARNSDENLKQELRKNGVLYSYFKVKGIAMPFPFLVHGTFDLTSDRNLLQASSEYNHELISLLSRFIGETAIKISKENQECDYTPLSLFIPSNMNMGILDSVFNFSEKLACLVKELPVFPSINNIDYISMADNPKYSAKRFCNYVNPSVFTNLLKFCEEEIISNYMQINCQIGFYDEDEFTDLINNDLEYYADIDIKNALVKLCLEQFNPHSYAHKKFNFPNLIVDNKNNVAKGKIFNNPSDTDNFKDLPAWADFVFINKEQEKKLRTLLNINSNEVFVNRLSDFGLESFRLDRIVSSLFNQANNNRSKIREVVKWLYGFWQVNNQQFDTNFTNVEPKTISRDGKIVNCSKCYFGQEYGNVIGEDIVSYLSNVDFLANTTILGLENEDIENIKMFFSHLLVKTFPKIQVASLTSQQQNQYIEYNSQRYTTLNTYYNGVNEVYNHRDFFSQWTRDIKVANIENLSIILENASFDSILTWILNDRNLYNHIIEQNEIDDYSAMIGLPPKKQDARRIGKNQMRSWLRKQFKEANWIQTKSGKKTNTYSCTLSDNGISPIIEVIDIDYKMFSRLDKNDIEGLFQKLDIANDIVDLSKEKIYEILLKLPEVDKGFSIGRKIYTHLNLYIKSDDGSLNRLTNCNRQYEDFKKNGRVLSKQNGIFGYRPISDVLYVDKKIYSDDILNNYPLLELGRRAGAEKIKNLFCVKPIQTIGKISVEYTEHKLNSEYNKKYIETLPYIYAKRLNADYKNKEFNLLNKGKLVLVEQASTTYTIGDKKQQGLLKDFELIFTDRTAYIKIPNSITLIQELCSEKRFCGVVAEMLTTLLDVDSDKSFFREIIGCNSLKEIEEIFKDEGDTNLELVKLAKKKFKNEVDYRVEFWNAVATAKSFRNGENLIEKYGKYLPNDFYYDNLNSEKNTASLINLFSILGIDIDEYNEGASERIDVIKYFENLFFELKQRLRKKYLCYAFSQTRNISKYENKMEQYDFASPEIKNSIKNNVNSLFETMFTVKITDLERQELFDVESKINLEKENIERIEQPANGKTANVQPEIDYRAINEEIKQSDNNNLDEIEIEKPDKSKQNTSVGGGGKRTTYNKENDAIKAVNGFKAESIVYHTLKKKYGETGSVVWVSGNGKNAGESEFGDDTLGYDIKYTDEKGLKHFVEVKSTSGDSIEFALTRNEFNFAQENKENYEIIFVFIKDGRADKPRQLGNIFLFENNEDIFNNSSFSIEQSEFKIRTKIKE